MKLPSQCDRLVFKARQRTVRVPDQQSTREVGVEEPYAGMKDFWRKRLFTLHGYKQLQHKLERNMDAVLRVYHFPGPVCELSSSQVLCRPKAPLTFSLMPTFHKRIVNVLRINRHD